MTPKGARSERETIVRFDDEGDTATVWTASGVVYRRLLKRLGRAYLTEDGERHAVFTMPKSLVRLPIKGKPVSIARRAALQRARSIRIEEKAPTTAIPE